MKFKEEFIYKGDSYCILHWEKDNILSWEAQQRLDQANSNEISTVSYVLENYDLKMKFDQQSEGDCCCTLFYVPYTGGMILVKDFVKDYGNVEDYPCYCYKEVLELIFEAGRLVTSIDHSKDMVRIRKNIEKGLRDIRNKRDFRCIQRFIKESFVQNYRNPMRKKKWTILLNKLIHNE